VRLRIAHYPPYTFNWNPIEHRLLSQVEHAWSGVTLDCPETAVGSVEQTPTGIGLRVTARFPRCNLRDRPYLLRHLP
jgi:hypothetical protein